MYTWMDATLKELEGLVKEVNPEARRRGTYFDFALVYPDLRQNPRCQTRDVGTTISGQKVSLQALVRTGDVKTISRVLMTPRRSKTASSLSETTSTLQ